MGAATGGRARGERGDRWESDRGGLLEREAAGGRGMGGWSIGVWIVAAHA